MDEGGNQDREREGEGRRDQDSLAVRAVASRAKQHPDQFRGKNRQDQDYADVLCQIDIDVPFRSDKQERAELVVGVLKDLDWSQQQVSHKVASIQRQHQTRQAGVPERVDAAVQALTGVDRGASGRRKIDRQESETIVLLRVKNIEKR